MARPNKVPESKAKKEQTHDIWATYGYQAVARLGEWDPDAQQLVNLLLTVLASGDSITLRPGSGGNTLGIQIWTWENKRPYIWFTEHEEIDQWVQDMIARHKAYIESKDS